jgi:hypothetical protein
MLGKLFGQGKVKGEQYQAYRYDSQSNMTE